MRRAPSDRCCTRCRKPYYRANLVRVWVLTNPGHRFGWLRVIQKLCVRCFKGPEAQGMLREINPTWHMPRNAEGSVVATTLSGKDLTHGRK